LIKYWSRFVAYAVGLFCGFEVLCRLFIGHSPAIGFDPRFDRLTLPHQPIVQSSEGFSRGRTNELGHLDAPMPASPPADGILVLGDSYTEARQVSQDERFTDRLGAILHRRVYNVGHTGWSPVNAVTFLAAEKTRFVPATVIVQVSPNDLGDITAAKRPHVEARGSGFEIVVPNRKKAGFAARITDLRETVSQRSAFGGELIVAGLSLFTGKDAEADGAGEPRTCAAPTAAQIQAMDFLVGELARLHPDVRLLYLPRLDYHGGCVERCPATRRMYELIAVTRHVRWIDTTAAICRRFHETRQPLHGFWNTIPGTGHVNAEGHSVIADELGRSFGTR
jgi:hypothetical protein